MSSPPIFVVGSGRCGSTLISTMLGLHPDILSISELFRVLGPGAFSYRSLKGAAFWKLLSSSRPGHAFLHGYQRAGSGAIPPLLHVVLPRLTDNPEMLFQELRPVVKALPKMSLAAHYANLFEWLRQRLGKRVWVERSGASLVFVPVLKEMYPNARFIHIFRDGRDVAVSMVNHTNMRLYVQGWLRVRRLGINALRRPTLMGENPIFRWLERAAFRFVDVQSMVEAPLSPYHAGLFWSEQISVGTESLQDLPPDRVLNLRYERLVSEPSRSLEEIITFIDVGLMNGDWIDTCASMPEPRKPAWQCLADHEISALERACRPGLTTLGYS